MLTISIAALLATTPPGGALPVTNMQIAGCMRATLAENNLTEIDARTIRMQTVIHIAGVRTEFKSGDTIWYLCELHLRRYLIVAREIQKLKRYLWVTQRRLGKIPSGNYLQHA